MIFMRGWLSLNPTSMPAYTTRWLPTIATDVDHSPSYGRDMPQIPLHPAVQLSLHHFARGSTASSARCRVLAGGCPEAPSLKRERVVRPSGRVMIDTSWSFLFRRPLLGRC